jgi:hypothetical protein
MFDLEQSIAGWRQQMRAAGIKTPVPLEELEIHLREEIERQMKSGLGGQKAFEVSVRQIGTARTLISEFKANEASSLAEKLMIAVCAVFVGFIAVLGAAAVSLCYATWGDRVMASTAMLCSLVVACRWRHLVPLLPVIADTRKRLAAGLACIAFGFGAPPFICDVILPRGVEGRLPAVALWTFFLLTVLFCAGVGLSINEREREIRGMKTLHSKHPLL